MENLFYNISQVLGITIIHSLWQGLIIYMVLHLIMQLAPNLSAKARYKAAFGALMLMLGWFVYTLVTEVDNYTWSAVTQYHNALPITALLPQIARNVATPADHYSFLIAGYMPYVTMLYIAGLVFNILKMALAWNNIYRIKQQTMPAGLQQQVSALAGKLGITRFVKVAFSKYIDVPCITGFIKPIILLPCTISTYLSADEVQVILLHELAHIRRNDYLLSLLQQAIGILLFFNPFSMIINRIINRERENCCDDMVVHTTGSPLLYAQALLKLEQNKHADTQLALAATGKKYHLLNRIERIMKTKNNTVNIRPALMALALLLCSLSSIAWFNPKIEHGKVSVKSIPNALTAISFGDTSIKQKPKATKPIAKIKQTKKQAMKTASADDEMSDAKMDDLSAKMEKHAEALEKYYNSAEFKKMQDDMEKKGAEMDAYFNSPKMKAMQDDLERKSAAFEKISESPEMKKLQEQLEANSKKIEAYYNGPEYAKIQKQYEKQAELYAKAKPGSAEYKKQQAEFKAMAEKFKDYTNNPAIKEQAELARKLSEQVRSYYQAPEYKKAQEEMRAYSDSMRKYYQDPMVKEQQETLRKMGKEMREFQKRPEIVQEQAELRKLQKQMAEYRSSSEYRKKRIAEIESVNRDVKERVRKEIVEARAYERDARDSERVKERRVAPARVTERPTKIRKPDTTRVRERAVKPEPAAAKPSAPATKPATDALIEARVMSPSENLVTLAKVGPIKRKIAAPASKNSDLLLKAKITLDDNIVTADPTPAR